MKGDTDYLETYFEVVEFITITMLEEDDDGGAIWLRHNEQGRGGLYELAEEWTDEFEKAHEGREWDGEWLEVIWDFCEQKNIENRREVKR
jgi:hypothetical protein